MRLATALNVGASLPRWFAAPGCPRPDREPSRVFGRGRRSDPIFGPHVGRFNSAAFSTGLSAESIHLRVVVFPSPTGRTTGVGLREERQPPLRERLHPALDAIDADAMLPGDLLDRPPLIQGEQPFRAVELLAAAGPLQHAPHPAPLRFGQPYLHGSLRDADYQPMISP